MASPQSRSSRNGSAKPAPPARKNTFQKMLDLERKNKIQRMQMSAPETHLPYRAVYPSAPVHEPQRRQTFNSKQTPAVPTLSQQTKVSATHSSPAMAGAPLAPQNPNLPRQQPSLQHRGTWSAQTNSIDSYLAESKPLDSTQLQHTAADLTPRSQSLSSFDTRMFATQATMDSSTTANATAVNGLQDETAHKKRRCEKSATSQAATSQAGFYNIVNRNGKMDDIRIGPSSNHFSALRNIPTGPGINMPRERSASQKMIPQYDGSSESKPSASVSFQNPTSESTNEGPSNESASQQAAPGTPPLQRQISNRSSLCRSPAWSVTHGERGKRMDEAKKARKKAAKEAEQVRQREEKETRERLERDIKEAKAAREKQEKEQKAAREREEKEKEKAVKETRERLEREIKEAKAAREREEKEKEKEVKAAIKQQKKLSKQPPSTPRRLTKGDRSSSMPIVPTTLTSRLTASSRLNSFQSSDGVEDSRRSFQTKPALLPHEGFIGGLKLAKARRAAMDQLEGLDEKSDAVNPVLVAPHRFGLDDGSGDEKEDEDEEFEKDMVRNAYHLALHDSSKSHLPIESPVASTPRRQTVGEVPSEKPTPQDIDEYLAKPKSPFYQMSQANNSFVDEIFHTIQKQHSKSSSTNSHPLRSNPSMVFERSDVKGSGQSSNHSERTVTRGSNDESLYDASSFAARMAKKSGSFVTIPSEVKVQGAPPHKDVVKNAVEPRQMYGNNKFLTPAGAIASEASLGAGLLDVANGGDVSPVIVQSGRRHQVTLMEGVNTKSHSMLIEKLTLDDQDEKQDQADEAPSVVPDTKQDTSKNRGSRSSSRDSSWFRRSSRDESKLSIQERRRSRSSRSDSASVASMPITSKEKSKQPIKETEPAMEKAQKPKLGRRNSISPTINSFKAGVKAAFSRYGPAAPSSKSNLPSSSLNRPGSSDGAHPISRITSDSRRQTLPSSVTMSSMGKADQILGQNLSSANIDRATSGEHFYGSKSSSVTTKGSEEEISSPEDVEDTSNITTPTGSRPSSKKDHLLTLKSTSSQPGGRFREEFSPDFLSALDRGNFSPSETSNGNSIVSTPVEGVSSIVPTPVASPAETRSSLSRPNAKSDDDGSLIADAIARVADFASPVNDKHKQLEEGTLVASKQMGQAEASVVVAKPERLSAASVDVLRQPSIKSSSTSNLPSLLPATNTKTEKPIDFSFLPALKHEALTRPPRASASPSLQAIAASLLGPPSTKSNKNGVSSAIKLLSNGLLQSPGLAGSGSQSPTTAVVPSTSSDSLHEGPKSIQNGSLNSSQSTPHSDLLPPRPHPNTSRASSLPPPESRKPFEHAPPIHSTKQAWLAAIQRAPAPDAAGLERESGGGGRAGGRDDGGAAGRGFGVEQGTGGGGGARIRQRDGERIQHEILRPVHPPVEPSGLLSHGTSMETSTSMGSRLHNHLLPGLGGGIEDLAAYEYRKTQEQKGDKHESQQLTQRPPKRTEKSKSFSLSSNLIKHPTGGSLEDPYAKCFLVCCGCKRYHDLPVKVYEMLLSANSDENSMDVSIRGGNDNDNGEGRLVTKGGKVACPWCEHVMTTACCENWAVCVKLVERLS